MRMLLLMKTSFLIYHEEIMIAKMISTKRSQYNIYIYIYIKLFLLHQYFGAMIRLITSWNLLKLYLGFICVGNYAN